MSKYCSKCGKENKDNYTICSSCGEQLNPIISNNDKKTKLR
ncbi:zinc-ribbon domain-containing protein [Clostridium beijerinckii]|nr:zinc-ribbon domain-containing protein [Clostridium beijerinckii]